MQVARQMVLDLTAHCSKFSARRYFRTTQVIFHIFNGVYNFTVVYRIGHEIHIIISRIEISLIGNVKNK